MADETGTPRASGIKWSRIVLAVSLALNLAVVGIVAGAALRHSAWDGPREARGERIAPREGVRDAATQRFRDRDLGLAPFLDAIEPEDRRALGQAFMRQAGDRTAARARVRAHVEAVVAALRAQTFDAEAFTALVSARQRDLAARLETGAGLLAEHVASMEAEERAAYADRIEAILRRPPRGH